MAGISSRMEAVRQDLTLQEGTLTDLEQERTTIAAACSGPRELKLGLSRYDTALLQKSLYGKEYLCLIDSFGAIQNK